MVKTKAIQKNLETVQNIETVVVGYDGFGNILPDWENALKKELKCFWESINDDVSE